jgi:hypothetical protein
MRQFCKDRDLLGMEPAAFLGGGFPARRLVRGTDGELAGTTFTSAGNDFAAAGVEAGMVLTLYTTTPAEGWAVEIVAVDAPTTLTVSVLRTSDQNPPVGPPPGSGLSFLVQSYDVQIGRVSDTLAEKLRRLSEAAGLAAADYADSVQLTTTTCYGVLADCFTARSASSEPNDANWSKARHYRELFQASQLQLRLAVDEDGDGFAEQTRTLAHIRLRRD